VKNLAQIRRAVDLELADVEHITGRIPTEHIAYVLLALDSLLLLREPELDAEDWRRLVRATRRSALEAATGAPEPPPIRTAAGWRNGKNGTNSRHNGGEAR
jgi:hypothetical protein